MDGVIPSIIATCIINAIAILLKVPQKINDYIGIDINIWVLYISLILFLFLILIFIFLRKRENILQQLIKNLLFIIILLFIIALLIEFVVVSRSFLIDQVEETLLMKSLLTQVIRFSFSTFLLISSILIPIIIYKSLILKKTLLQKIEEFGKKNLVCPLNSEIEKLREITSFSITGTCIPFKYREDLKVIETYLICNTSYENREWMFPGGHAFHYADRKQPETVAKDKASTEAGLVVKILNLNESHEDTDEIFSVLLTPHFTYKFKLTDRVKCFHEKGHKYHYDCVFIGEIVDEQDEYSTKRIKLQIPINTKNIKEIESILQQNIINSSGRRDKVTLDPLNINYASTMLFNAYNKYRAIKKIGDKK